MKNYVVIGGSSGIGLALVNALREQGHQVWASYHENAQASRDGVNYFPYQSGSDLNIELPEVIDGVAYCPGSITLKPFHRNKEEDFIEDYRLQVGGAIKVIQQLLPQLKKSESSSIVLFSTIAVQQGFNFHSLVSSSKGAIEGLTRALAAELAPKIRVNAVAPSLTNTPLAERLLSTPEKVEAQAQKNPLKRVGEAEDIAEAAAYLLSDKSSWVSGQILHVDGGYSSIK